MQLVVESFENVLNKGKQGPKNSEIAGKYFSNSALVQGRAALGGVDAMMKKDIAAIVNAYKKRILKDPGIFKIGKVKIEIKVSDKFMGPSETIVIDGFISK